MFEVANVIMPWYLPVESYEFYETSLILSQQLISQHYDEKLFKYICSNNNNNNNNIAFFPKQVGVG